MSGQIIRVMDLRDAPPQARRRAESLLDVEGLHRIRNGFWLFCGPLQRTAGHRLSVRGQEPREGALHIIIQHDPPARGLFAAQVMTRPHLLFALDSDRDVAVTLREPDGQERVYRPCPEHRDARDEPLE